MQKGEIFMNSINEYVYTGYTDMNNIPIFVGDTVKEGCNGLVSTVIWKQELATFGLKGLGDDYVIQDAKIEWEVLNSENWKSPMYHKQEGIILSV